MTFNPEPAHHKGDRPRRVVIKPDRDLLKDAFLLAIEALLQNPDGKIAGKLARGEPLTEGERSHVWMECRILEGLSPEHKAAVERLAEPQLGRVPANVPE